MHFILEAVSGIQLQFFLAACSSNGIKTGNDKAEKSTEFGRLLKLAVLPLLLLFLTVSNPNSASAQGAVDEARPKIEGASFTRLNTWSIFGEYSPNSSHIFLGVSQQRRLLIFGGEYSRRLLLNRWVGLHYLIQARPVVLENDPALVGLRRIDTGQFVSQLSPPIRVESVSHALVVAIEVVGGVSHAVKALPVYTRQWTYAGGINPLGIKLNLWPRHRIQPVFSSTAGFLLSARDIPIDHSSNFNFSFDFGAGIEWFQSPRRSFRFDYRLHHISNAYIGRNNPGIDSGLFQLTYSFGK